jgi:hypothetical protein
MSGIALKSSVVADVAGYDFKLEVDSCVILVEVKATAGSVRDAQVLLSRNQLEVMHKMRTEKQTSYLVMVVGNVGKGTETHRFFTWEDVVELGQMQALCQVKGDGQEGKSAMLSK